VEQPAQPSFIVIARIVRTRGNRGEVLADLYTDFPARFDSLADVWLEWPDGSRKIVKVENTWEHKGRRVLKFEGIDSISSAERLPGAWLMVEFRNAVPLDEGTYFDHDLVGCTVNSTGGEELGTVKEVIRITGNNQLLIMGKHGEFMVPAVDGICREVSIERKRIVVDLPEGLIDLNK
jgi:16S rRNA processing protein RimM